jgi:hypothetical protein
LRQKAFIDRHAEPVYAQAVPLFTDIQPGIFRSRGSVVDEVSKFLLGPHYEGKVDSKPTADWILAKSSLCRTAFTMFLQNSMGMRLCPGGDAGTQWLLYQRDVFRCGGFLFIAVSSSGVDITLSASWLAGMVTLEELRKGMLII